MNIQEIIIKKRDKQILSKNEIEYFIKNYTNESISDYQAAALIMAISCAIILTLSLGFSRQEHWSGLPFPSPMHESEKRK